MNTERRDIILLKQENEKLVEENLALRKQLRLFQENCSLRAATVFTSLLTWLDADKTRFTQTEGVVRKLEEAIKSFSTENLQVPHVNIHAASSGPIPVSSPFPLHLNVSAQTSQYPGKSVVHTSDNGYQTLQEAYDTWASYRQKKKTVPKNASTKAQSKQVQSGEVESNQIQSNKVQSNQVPSYQVQSNQVQPNQFQSYQVHSNQVQSNPSPSYQVYSNQVQSSELPSYQKHSNQTQSNKVQSNQVQSNQDGLIPGLPNVPKGMAANKNSDEQEIGKNVKKFVEGIKGNEVPDKRRVQGKGNTSGSYQVEIKRYSQPQQVPAFSEVFESESLSETSSDSEDQAVPKEWSTHGHIWTQRTNQLGEKTKPVYSPKAKTLPQNEVDKDRESPKLVWKQLLNQQTDNTLSPPNKENRVLSPQTLVSTNGNTDTQGYDNLIPLTQGLSLSPSPDVEEQSIQEQPFGSYNQGTPTKQGDTRSGSQALSAGSKRPMKQTNVTIHSHTWTPRNLGARDTPPSPSPQRREIKQLTLKNTSIDPKVQGYDPNLNSQRKEMVEVEGELQPRRLEYNETMMTNQGNNEISVGFNHIGFPIATSTPGRNVGVNLEERRDTTSKAGYVTDYATISQERSTLRPELQEILRFLNNAKPNKRLIGEVAYQLDRRILSYIFNINREDRPYKRRFYGYTLQNIPDMIKQESFNRLTGQFAPDIEAKLRYRVEYIVRSLTPLGYDLKRHAMYSADLVNRYGLLPIPSTQATAELFNLDNRDFIAEYLMNITPKQDIVEVMVLFECLSLLARDEARPLFLW